MATRFFVEQIPNSETFWLEGDQAHHAVQVMRCKLGDELTLFDGKGWECQTTVQTVAKRKLELKIGASLQVERAIKQRIVLAVAIPKGDRQKFLVEKMVELGVDELIPLETRRGVAVPNAKVIQRLSKQVVEACKQCGRNRLMKISEPKTISNLIKQTEGQYQCFVADPYEGQPVGMIEVGSQPALIVIGPEGGLSQEEVEQLKSSDFAPLRLGPSVLRIETAAIAVASVLGIGRWNPVEQA